MGILPWWAVAAEDRLGLRRTLGLANAFRYEQRDPARFYRTLAADSVAEVARHLDLAGASVLDVGGGPGYFADAFVGAGARYLGVERHVDELAGCPPGGPGVDHRPDRRVVADGSVLPFVAGRFDLCYSSNVLEHVERPWDLLAEMIRTVRPGGVVFVAFTNWYSPWGGHETSPWHFLGGERAAHRYQRRHGRPPKNRFGTTLFPVHVGQVLRWAGARPDVDVVDARPRYYPPWCRGLVAVPGLREVATWNLATVLRKRAP